LVFGDVRLSSLVITAVFVVGSAVFLGVVYVSYSVGEASESRRR